MFTNKTIVIGVTGSIAAYKAAELCSKLVKQHADVHVIMTKNALNFINPITFETLTRNKCLVDTFDRNFKYDVTHVSLAQKADLFFVAPASANVIAKMAYGLADDMLTTTALACKCKKIVAPAMNTAMYQNPIVKDNLKILAKYGFEIVKPESGFLACRDIGEGKLASVDVLYDYVERELAFPKDLKGLNILVTAGATCEKIDPVRFITNNSTGKMGYALAKAAMLRGANVTLISGRTNLLPINFVNTINVLSASDMFSKVTELADKNDIIIKAAAVADYTPKEIFDSKIKKSDNSYSLELKRTEDILKYLGEQKKGYFLCGFSMETENLLENSRKKLVSKNADMIVANTISEEGSGFGFDTNKVTIITKDNNEELPLMSKNETAHRILDAILKEKQ